ncbi:hypothetical protein BKA81DRAFT_422191 [Phyllosticta paracitricarpa]|uniref:Single-strand DNA deaminase toxin A-like C-terminal domain-containing protein n=1 Tax=Phyllosticta citricarpa TaxID=55181 RepID=A0ABR1LK72_9PEZI
MPPKQCQTTSRQDTSPVLSWDHQTVCARAECTSCKAELACFSFDAESTPFARVENSTLMKHPKHPPGCVFPYFGRRATSRFEIDEASRRYVALDRCPPQDPTVTFPKPQVGARYGHGTINFFRLEAEITILDPRKTIAILQRGGEYPDIVAISGFGKDHDIVKESQPFLRGQHSTDEALWVAKGLCYEFERHPRLNHGTPGSYNASHAEPQLIAYFLSRHVFFPFN